MSASLPRDVDGGPQRAARRLLRLCLLITCAVHVQALLRYAWMGEGLLVLPQLVSLGLLGLSAVLLQRQGQTAASLLFIATVALGVSFQVLWVDRPTAQLPRTQQLYLLPLLLVAYELLPGRRRWLRNSVLAALMLLYVGLAGMPSLQQEPLISEGQRLFSACVVAALVVVLLVGLSQLADSGWIAQTALEVDLARAVASGSLSLALQPQCDADGRLIGAEALVRWHDAQRGWVSPAEFVPLAERSGLVLALGEGVLAQALQLLQRWQQQPALAGMPLAVNLSALQLQDSAHLQRLLERVAAAGLPAGSVKFELTETAMVAEPERLRELLARCRGLGIGTALDDFGTGYASLALLAQLPFDQLKIDQHFVRRLPGNARGQELVRNLVALGQRLGMAVIAEGVESAEHVQLLREMEVRQFQGYHFARPMAPDAFEAWCLQRWQEAQESLP